MPLVSPQPNALTPPSPVSLPTSHARLSTRQGAWAFNQPLSFDTSSVTTMQDMFKVRSARALSPPALSRALPVHAACVAATQRPHASRPVYLFPRRMPALSTRQAAYAFNQPLSFDTSKVTDMRYMFDVRSARALGPPASSPSSCTPFALYRRPTPSHRASHALLSTRQGSSGRLI